MAKKSKRRASNDPLGPSHTTRWLVGLGFIAVGIFIIAASVLAGTGGDEARARAALEQTFVSSACLVEDVSVRRLATYESDNEAELVVTYTVQVGDQTYPGVVYAYPYYAYTKPAAEQAAKTTHRKGQKVACFYNPQNPKDAVLMKRAAPDPTPPSNAGSWLFGIIGSVIFIVGIAILLTRKPWSVANSSVD
ncbi:MAG: DUF3592 domain-containing protein [Polyangiaceae bacterium]|nr:DUF3592 domain-containing protein [Polyangiaceae bacterium]